MEVKEKEQKINELTSRLSEWISYTTCREFKLGFLRKKILRICTSSKLMKIIIQIIRKYLPDNEFEKIVQELLKHKYVKIM